MSNLIVSAEGELLNVTGFEKVAVEEANKLLDKLKSEVTVLENWLASKVDTTAAPAEPVNPPAPTEPVAPAPEAAPEVTPETSASDVSVETPATPAEPTTPAPSLQ